jgi:chemotaxis protein MotB
MVGTHLKELSNPVDVEGHTDSVQYATPNYDNWNLSFDRAKAAKIIMESAGLTGRIKQVNAFADTRPRVRSNPMDPTNRRVAILVRYNEKAKEATPQMKEFFKGNQLTPGDGS